jgi:hypothetical protein
VGVTQTSLSPTSIDSVRIECFARGTSVPSSSRGIGSTRGLVAWCGSSFVVAGSSSSPLSSVGLDFFDFFDLGFGLGRASGTPCSASNCFCSRW